MLFASEKKKEKNQRQISKIKPKLNGSTKSK